MTRSVQPLNDRVLVKRMLAEEKTAGGILIPDNAKEKPVEGKVIAVGEGKILDDGSRQTMEVKTGDKILFGKWGGTEIKLDGEEHLLIREDEILAVLN